MCDRTDGCVHHSSTGSDARVSAREWKPGDVIAALLDGNEIVGIVRGGSRDVVYADSVTSDQVAIRHLSNVRPLVVIDPEDREQVKRLLNDYWRRVTSDYVLSPAQKYDALADALREFANPTPPKPDEPTGLGAVVRYDGSEWVSLGEHRWLEIPADRAAVPRRWHWADFPGDVEKIQDGWVAP